jgi:predicted transcriptional regulator YheO
MTHPLWPYQSAADAVAALFKPHAEVVLHDLSTGKIYYLANGFSKRTSGDPSLSELENDHPTEQNVLGPYPKTNWDGRSLRSITAVLRPDPDADPIGLMCINLDVSAFHALAGLAKSFLAFADAQPKASALLGADWREEANEIIGQFLCDHALTLASMDRQQREDLIGLLDQRGIFDIRNAIPYVAQIMQISRATLYKTLKHIRALYAKVGTGFVQKQCDHSRP